MAFFITGLRCDDCAAQYSDLERLNTCPRCGGLLEAQYDYDGIRASLSKDDLLRRPRHLWRWRELMPIRDEANIVTLGEGGSPLVRMERLGQSFGIGELYAKNDTVMPTATFKDRSFTTSVSKAKEIGVKRAATYTSGNAGASFAAYAAKAGLEALILAKAWATEEKLAMMGVYGHPMVKLDFDSFAPVKEMLDRSVTELGAYQFTLFINPFRHEGYKSFAFEIAEEFDWSVPDVLIHPTSHGGGFYGCWKGWQELKRLGWIDRLPRMVAAQPSKAAPIVRAFERRDAAAEQYGDPKATMAQSVGTDAPIGQARRILKTLYESNGAAVGVSEDEILEGIRLLGREGIYSEPAGALPVIAAKKLAEQGVIGPNDRVVCAVTGSGLKQPEAARLACPQHLRTIRADFDEYHKLLREIWPGGEL